MVQRCLRGLLWLIPLLAVAFWGAWQWWLPGWLSARLADELDAQGITLTAIHWQHIGLLDTAVDSLSLLHRHSQTTIEASHLLVRYRPESLYRGDLSSLHIDIGRLQLITKRSQDQHFTLVSPLPLLALLPVASLRLDSLEVTQDVHHWHGQAMLHADTLRLRLREASQKDLQLWLRMQRHGALFLNLQQQQQTLMQLTGYIRQQGHMLQLQAQLRGRLEALHVLHHQWQADGDVQAQLQCAVPDGDYRDIPQLLQRMTAQLDLHAEGKWQAAANHLAGVLDARLHWQQGQGRWQLSPATALSFAWHDVSGRLQQPRLRGSFAVSRGALRQFTLDQDAILPLQSFAYGGFELDRLRLHSHHRLRYDVATARLSALDLELQPSALHWQDWRLSPRLLHLQTTAWQTGQAVDASLQITSMGVQHPRLRLPARDWELQLSMAKTWRFSCSYAYQRQSPWTLKGDFQPQGNRLQARLAIALNKPGQQLAALSPTLARQLKVLKVKNGRLQATARLMFSPLTTSLDGSLTVSDWSGTLNKLPFTGLGGEMRWALKHGKLHIPAMQWHMDTLDAGLPLHQWLVKGSGRVADDWQFKFDVFRLHALGGRLEANNIRLRSHQGKPVSQPFTLRLRTISLAQLVALEKRQGIEASGILDGVLPAQWLHHGLRIRHGKLQVRQPGGVIRYTGNAASRAMAANHPGVKLAMRVLGNFHYHRLDADADYQPDGRLQLALHLAGHNPDYDKGRPVNFNLSIEENVLTLLKSLSLANDISEQLRQGAR